MAEALVVRDEVATIRQALGALLARADVDVVVVTGGTGIAPRDVTIEAVEPLLDRTLPGVNGRLFTQLADAWFYAPHRGRYRSISRVWRDFSASSKSTAQKSPIVSSPP